MNRYPHGTNLRRSLRRAKVLKCDVKYKRGTGEIVVDHPKFPHAIRVNARRHDTPRSLSKWLIRLERGML